MEQLDIAIGGDGVANLTLNRPHKANALDAALVEALHAALDQAFETGVRLIVLRGEGRNFCAGFDFSGFEELSTGDLCWRFVRIEQLLQRVAHAPCTTLALARGGCFGAGADLVVACGRRLAASDTRFRMPGWRFGLALGTRRLVRRVGSAAAVRILEEAAQLDAAAAHGIGLVDELVEATQWDARIAALRAALPLDPVVRARLAATSLVNTRDADMAALVESLTAGDLKARIRAFRQGA